MRILIRRGQFVNKGAEAMIRTVQRELGQRLPQAEFFIASESVFAGTSDQVDRAGLSRADENLTRWQKAWRAGCMMASDPTHARGRLQNRQWMRIQRVVEQVDAIIDVAGFAYGDTWGPAKSIQANEYITFARRRGVPYVFMPQAWGPFDKAGDHRHYAAIVNGAALVYARDEESQQYLTALPGVEREIPLRPDIAFQFSGADEAFARTWLADQGHGGDTPLIGIAPNQKVFERTAGEGEENIYIQALREVGRFFEGKGCRVVLVPHEIYPSKQAEDDDRGLCRLVADGLQAPLVLDGVLSAEQIKGIVGRCSFMVGSRFHALIAALSQAIPAVAIAWSHKYEGLFRDCGLDGFVVSREGINRERVVQLVEDAWKQRQATVGILEQRLKGIRNDIDRTFLEVAGVLES